MGGCTTTPYHPHSLPFPATNALPLSLYQPAFRTTGSLPPTSVPSLISIQPLLDSNFSFSRSNSPFTRIFRFPSILTSTYTPFASGQWFSIPQTLPSIRSRSRSRRWLFSDLVSTIFKRFDWWKEIKRDSRTHMQ